MRIWILITACILTGYTSRAQTYSAPELSCATTLTSGNVDVSWVLPTVSCGSFNSYKIYGSNTGKSGPYSLLTTIVSAPTTTWTHTGAMGTTTKWFYYMESDFACAGYTPEQSDTICNRDPIEPEINFVSVIPTGVEISWVPSVSPQTRGYIIYRNIAGFIAIDTVWGRNANYYIDAGASPNTKAEIYTIASVDTCRNVGPLNNFPQNSIYLTVDIDSCAQEAYLDWNLYQNWLAGVREYEIWLVTNGVPALINISAAGSTNFTHKALFNDGDTLCYFIRAINDNGIHLSNSNPVCEVLSIIQPAKYNFIRRATVVNDLVDIEFIPDNKADLKAYEIYRGTNSAALSRIDRYPVGTITQPELYTDNSSNPNGESYFYRTETFDSCGNSIASLEARTIYFQADFIDDITNSLNWNAYEQGDGTVLAYHLYRFDLGTWTLINSYGPGTTSAIDNVGVAPGEQPFCYYLEAEYDFHPAGFPAETLFSSSNQDCSDPPVQVLVPNAFAPNGVNKVFRPVFNYTTSISNFQMRIFNRWGNMVIETSDYINGWNGKQNGADADAGVYIYYIQYHDQNGDLQQMEGALTLIR